VGAARVLVEQGWALDSSVRTVRDLIGAPDTLRQMCESAANEARPNAAEHAAEVIESLLAGRPAPSS